MTPKAINIKRHPNASQVFEQTERLEQVVESRFKATVVPKQEPTDMMKVAEGRLQRASRDEDAPPELAGNGQSVPESGATKASRTSWDPLKVASRLPAAHEGRNHPSSESKLNRSQPLSLGFGAGLCRPKAA
jgi:hypothetical protein